LIAFLLRLDCANCRAVLGCWGFDVYMHVIALVVSDYVSCVVSV
jgi:hypothetical protein